MMDSDKSRSARSLLDELGTSPTLRQQLITLMTAGCVMGIISGVLASLDLI
jgi:hypothetical protein